MNKQCIARFDFIWSRGGGNKKAEKGVLFLSFQGMIWMDGRMRKQEEDQIMEKNRLVCLRNKLCWSIYLQNSSCHSNWMLLFLPFLLLSFAWPLNKSFPRQMSSLMFILKKILKHFFLPAPPFPFCRPNPATHLGRTGWCWPYQEQDLTIRGALPSQIQVEMPSCCLL